MEALVAMRLPNGIMGSALNPLTGEWDFEAGRYAGIGTRDLRDLECM